MTSKIARGSAVILLGSFIFRIGGYVNRYLMAFLLGPAGYGIFGLAVPIMGILQLSAEGGIPPAVAKYVAEYDAKKQADMVNQIIRTSSKLIIIMGFLLSVVIFILAEPIALGFFHKPEAILPFKAIALITPFSVLTGELKGVFQGFYQMRNIVIVKAFEQSFTIIFAVVLILAGYYVAGAVVGNAIGYMVAAIAGFILFRKYVWNHISKFRKKSLTDENETFTFKEELRLAKILLVFSIPVVITSLGELLIYDSGTFIIGHFMPAQYVGYYSAASPIARLPLIISMAVATAVLPATSAALGTNNRDLVSVYVNQAFRYVILAVLPLSVGTIIFSTPILNILWPAGYGFASDALKILAAGMLFFTIYTVASSISQGMGKPTIPMVALLGGTVIELAISIWLIPIYGINGAAIATTIAAFSIMVAVVWRTLKSAEVKLPFGDYGKILIASLIMGGIIYFIPQSLFIGLQKYFYFLVVLIVAVIIYVATLVVIGGLKKSDVNAFRKLTARAGPLSNILKKLADFLERFAT